MSFIPLLQAAQQQGANPLMSVVPFILIIAIFYFFIIRPQNKKQKETEKMINALKKGDKVVTIGGIHGVVSSTKEKTVIVKVDSNTSIEFSRSAISGVVVDKPAAKTPSKKTKKDEVKEEAKKEEPAVEAEKSAEKPAAPAAETSEENK